MEELLNHSSDSSYTEGGANSSSNSMAKSSKFNVKLEADSHGIGTYKTQKDDATMMVLRYYYTLNKKINQYGTYQGYTKPVSISKICEESGLSKRQVYKWMWDEQKRGGKADDYEIENEIDAINTEKYLRLNSFKANQHHFRAVCTGITMPNYLKNRIPEQVMENLLKNIFVTN